MVCEVASSEIVEKQATEEVCALIKEHFPSVKIEPDCETVVKALWDEIIEMCPKGKAVAISFPSPEEIEKMVCEVASSEIVEKQATEEVCALIKEHFPSVKIEPDCDTVVKALWDEIIEMCPKGKQVALGFPTPEDIEKMVCEVASSETIEKQATDEVCALIKEHFPSVTIQPDCPTVVEALWDKVKAMCPKVSKVGIPMPTPEEIEKLACEVASSEVIEKE